ncbi:hypothetical protein Tco_0530141 [Tanacetum coccineum]
MKNANPPPTNNHPVLPDALRARAVQELHELQVISAFVDSRLESIEQFLNNFANQPNETNMNDLESDDESVDTLLVSPFPHSDNDSNDGRKAHLLEDKKIPSVGLFDKVFLALGCNLEEIHVTWTHLEKKQARLRTYTKSLEELCKQCIEAVSQA